MNYENSQAISLHEKHYLFTIRFLLIHISEDYLMGLNSIAYRKWGHQQLLPLSCQQLEFLKLREFAGSCYFSCSLFSPFPLLSSFITSK